jgi:exopolysaccharide biosynthesis WecB/TagA/CpsF family protein
LADRVYGPEFMLRLCEAAAGAGVGVYLYGSTPGVVDKLKNTLVERFGGLRVVGAESPPFRPLTEGEGRAAVDRFNASGAGIVFVGTGCPRQELFAAEHRDRVRAVLVCVGAAFDFHAGAKRMAPPWMQRRGLEWLYRLCQEPGRLWRRYLVTNTIFSLLVGRRLLLGR